MVQCHSHSSPEAAFMVTHKGVSLFVQLDNAYSVYSE